MSTRRPPRPHRRVVELVEAEHERRLCASLTAKGQPCRKPPLTGDVHCATHARQERVGEAKLTPEIGDRLVAALTAGALVETASASVGIGRSTLRLWMRRGRSDDPADEPYRQLAERVERARATARVRAVAILSKASETDWRAAAWYLERTDPAFARPLRVRSVLDDAIAGPPAGDDESADPFDEVDELARRRARES